MRYWMMGLLAATCLAAPGSSARADIALSSNDSHSVLENGAQVAAKDGQADTLSVVDLKGRPRIVSTIEVPGSVVGPPTAVALAPDESWAIVTSATKLDPAGGGGIGADDRVSVIDLTVTPPSVVQTLHAGAGATTVRIAPGGGMAIVVNRTEGTLTVFTVKDRRLTFADKVGVDPKSLPSGLVFLPDGKTALLSRYGDHQVSVLHVDGTAVTIDKRPLTTALAPYTVDISADGRFAAVSNMGRGDGDVDSVSLIDLGAVPYRVIQTLDVGRSPEGLRWSPDGRFLAVGLQNGTTKPGGNPFLRANGRLIMLALVGKQLRPVAEAPIGRWNQGIAFSRDGRRVLVQNMVERNIEVFAWDGRRLLLEGALAVGSGPAAIATSWK